MHPETQLSLVLDRGHDVLIAAALADRVGIARVWTTEGAGLDGAARVGLMCRIGDALPLTAGQVWIRNRWSEATRALVTQCIQAGVEVSADADGASAVHILAHAAIPVLSMPSMEAMLRAAATVSAGVRGPAPVRLAALLAVSPGRTSAEAQARVRLDPDFARTASSACSIVGTLEDCQQAVANLIASGVSDLRMSIPATPDFADLLAQLATLGSAALQRVEPGAPRSEAPAPPAEWGGRP